MLYYFFATFAPTLPSINQEDSGQKLAAPPLPLGSHSRKVFLAPFLVTGCNILCWDQMQWPLGFENLSRPDFVCHRPSYT